MKYLLNRERLRRQTFKETEPKYIALKSIVHNQTLPNSLRWEASLLLSKIIKKNSRSSFKNRCFLTGRGGSYSRFFNLSRIQVRELARDQKLPFIKKSSW
jgi:ribosomal protein S14